MSVLISITAFANSVMNALFRPLAGMIESARRIARTLGGDVLDETGSTLTNQGATHLREQVIEFQRRSQIGLPDE